MKKEDKGQIIAQLAETIQAYPHFYLVDVTALDAAATSELRRKCFKQEVKMVVVKNTLLQKALESLEGDFSPLYGALKGKGLHCLGDSSGWTRGLMMASVMGVIMGRIIASRP